MKKEHFYHLKNFSSFKLVKLHIIRLEGNHPWTYWYYFSFSLKLNHSKYTSNWFLSLDSMYFRHISLCVHLLSILFFRLMGIILLYKYTSILYKYNLIWVVMLIRGNWFETCRTTILQIMAQTLINDENSTLV